MENMLYFADEVYPVFIGALIAVFSFIVALFGRVLVCICKKYFSSAGQPLEKPTLNVYSDQKNIRCYTGEDIRINAIVENKSAILSVTWRKEGNGNIDTEIPKYKGSSSKTDKLQLVINNCNKNDEGIYFLIATCRDNEEIQSNKIHVKIVKGDHMIFISGPVVVSPSRNIEYMTMSQQDLSNTKWLRIKQSHACAEEIQFNDISKCIYNVPPTGDTRCQKIEIINACKDDTAAYQMQINNMKSNTINTFVDDLKKYTTENKGNSLRFFALQTVSANAMRIAFDSRLPAEFADKINKFKQHLRLNAKDQNSRQLLKYLEKKNLASTKDLDVTLMYKIIRSSGDMEKPTNGWGNAPSEKDIKTADDIERIRLYRNYISHENATDMDTATFNKSVLDLIWAIQRLSEGNDLLIDEASRFMNKIFTAGESIQEMEALKKYQEETKKWENFCQIKESGDITPNTDSSNKIEEMHSHKDFDSESKDETATSKMRFHEIRFHEICDYGIQLSDLSKTAYRSWWSRDGVCFLNQPMKLGKAVYIKGSRFYLFHYLYHGHFIKIGLTNKNPDQMYEYQSKKTVIEGTLQRYNYCTCHNKNDSICTEGFELIVTLCQNAKLSIRLKGADEESSYFPEVSSKDSIWLVMEPCHFDMIQLL